MSREMLNRQVSTEIERKTKKLGNEDNRWMVLSKTKEMRSKDSWICLQKGERKRWVKKGNRKCICGCIESAY